MGCGDEKLSKYLTQTFTAHCNALICQQVTLSGDAEWPKVADAVIEAPQTFSLFHLSNVRGGENPATPATARDQFSHMRLYAAKCLVLPRQPLFLSSLTVL